MQPRIEFLTEKKLVGHFLSMSLQNNRTFELWSGFMPKKRLVKNRIGTSLYSLQVYPKSKRESVFSPAKEFVKWAAVEVSEFENDDFETMILPAGEYAVFIHKGPPSGFPETMNAIFNGWLPNSGYELDNRPHFELLGEKYKNNHPDSEEEVWIPIKEIKE
ncbi:GyrI-like domain-containing protein [Cytophaga sp. FL35]|uniref:GyrI-like domain-containing protein n=1 Tax=Cytophaga sp. FL35 TaxID=1904456 RepID=UPI00165397A1|nr:GyrI-like domain-containing protein [Cytophaga sp. FL35]MBC6998106.1 GyrI-like domain-containing protein [Cytophaga sp. FL35]